MAKLYLKDLRKSVRKVKRTVRSTDIVPVHAALPHFETVL